MQNHNSLQINESIEPEISGNIDNAIIVGRGSFGQAITSVVIEKIKSNKLCIDTPLRWLGRGSYMDCKKKLLVNSIKFFKEKYNPNSDINQEVNNIFWWTRNTDIIFDIFYRHKGNFKEIEKKLFGNLSKIHIIPELEIMDLQNLTREETVSVLSSDLHIVALPQTAVSTYYVPSLLDVQEDINNDLIRVLVLAKGASTINGNFENVAVTLDREVDDKFKIGLMSGPNFANEIIDRRFTQTSVSFFEDKLGELGESSYLLKDFLDSDYFRPVIDDNNETLGLISGGVFKNVLALLYGYASTRIYSSLEHAKFKAFLFECLKKYSLDMGVKDIKQLYNCFGIGDLLMCCDTNGDSRNMKAGRMLANGSTISEIEDKLEVVEGLSTIKKINGSFADKDFREIDFLQDLISGDNKVEWKEIEQLSLENSIPLRKSDIKYILSFSILAYLNHKKNIANNTKASSFTDLMNALNDISPDVNTDALLPYYIYCFYHLEDVEDNFLDTFKNQLSDISDLLTYTSEDFENDLSFLVSEFNNQKIIKLLMTIFHH